MFNIACYRRKVNVALSIKIRLRMAENIVTKGFAVYNAETNRTGDEAMDAKTRKNIEYLIISRLEQSEDHRRLGQSEYRRYHAGGR